MNQSIDMMLRYPSIIPVDIQSDQSQEYRGYLPVNGIDYEIIVSLDENGSPKLTITSQLKQFEPDINAFQNSPESDSKDVISLIDSLRQILLMKTRPRLEHNLTDKYRLVLDEYVELRDFYIGISKCTISEDMTQVKINQIDEYGRMNELVIACKLSNDGEDTEIFNVTEHSFPEKQAAQLFKASNSLKDIYERFISIIGSLQNFYELMDSFDNNCWILDPDKPTRKDCYRRIGLEQNLSMIVTIDPWIDVVIPHIKFLGPERLVENYREKLSNNLPNWNHKNKILDEILVVLELKDFPQRPAQMKDKSEILLYETGECCICFSSRLNEALPEIVCPNESCEQCFHTECLYLWLISVGAKQSFNELHGNCPNCEKHITCPIN